jgi:hypothetical protein
MMPVSTPKVLYRQPGQRQYEWVDLWESYVSDSRMGGRGKGSPQPEQQQAQQQRHVWRVQQQLMQVPAQ